MADSVKRRTHATPAPFGNQQPDGPKPPPPFVGYLVENADWAMPKKTRTSWATSLPLMFATVKDARAEREGFRAMAPKDSDKVILEATITFRVVEGGNRD